jgi:hypothetical protein
MGVKDIVMLAGVIADQPHGIEQQVTVGMIIQGNPELVLFTKITETG